MSIDYLGRRVAKLSTKFLSHYNRPAVFVSNGFNDVRPTPPSLFQNNSSDPIVDEQTR